MTDKDHRWSHRLRRVNCDGRKDWIGSRWRGPDFSVKPRTQAGWRHRWSYKMQFFVKHLKIGRKQHMNSFLLLEFLNGSNCHRHMTSLINYQAVIRTETYGIVFFLWLGMASLQVLHKPACPGSLSLVAVCPHGHSFASLRMGRMSVIQYLNSGTMAAVSSKGENKDEPESGYTGSIAHHHNNTHIHLFAANICTTHVLSSPKYSHPRFLLMCVYKYYQ